MPLVSLTEAAEANDTESVRIALASGGNPDGLIQGELRPSHHATMHGNAEMAAVLLEAGAAAYARGRDDRTPMHCCSAAGKPECVALLLHAGSDPNSTDANLDTALHLAASFRLARRSFGEPVGLDKWRRTAWATSKRLAGLLLAAAANPSLKNRNGETPADILARRRNDAMFNLLLRAGGATANADGKLFNAVCLRRPKAVAAALKAGGNPSMSVDLDVEGELVPLLAFAIMNGDLPAVMALLEAGAAADERFECAGKGETLSSWAARFGGIRIVNAILDAGGDVNAASATGETPLIAAAEGSSEEIGPSPEVIRLLLGKGSDVEAVGRFGIALHVAAAVGHRVAMAGGFDSTLRRHP